MMRIEWNKDIAELDELDVIPEEFWNCRLEDMRIRHHLHYQYKGIYYRVTLNRFLSFIRRER
jgi:hypothetical protein